MSVHHQCSGMPSATARKLKLLPNGSVLSDRARSKIRRRERGWRYASAQLVEHGAAPLDESEDSKVWLAKWETALVRELRHPGNHKYLWAVDKRARKHLPESLKYPKFSLGST